jgi:polysaccharide biosynthesis/export protein
MKNVLLAAMVALGGLRPSMHLLAQAPPVFSERRPIDETVHDSEYHIGKGDVLDVLVWKQPDASITGLTVRPVDGKVSLQLLGEVVAAGLTPVELQKVLTDGLARYFKDPAVTVAVKEVHSKGAYVMGAVNKPCEIQIINPITVLQALAKAGGLAVGAKKKNICVYRMRGAEKVCLPFDYQAVIKARLDGDIVINPGDTINVPN